MILITDLLSVVRFLVSWKWLGISFKMNCLIMPLSFCRRDRCYCLKGWNRLCVFYKLLFWAIKITTILILQQTCQVSTTVVLRENSGYCCAFWLVFCENHWHIIWHLTNHPVSLPFHATHRLEVWLTTPPRFVWHWSDVVSCQCCATFCVGCVLFWFNPPSVLVTFGFCPILPLWLTLLCDALWYCSPQD